MSCAVAVGPGDTVFNQVMNQEREITNVEDHGRNRRCPGRDLRQEPPVAQPSRSVAMDEVAVRNVSRERGAVDQQHAGTPPGEEHRQ